MRRGHRTRVLAVGFVVAMTSVMGPSGVAQAKNRTPTTSTTSISLTSETVQWNPNVSTTSCLTEDDFDQRNFSGSLNGSFSTSYQLCDLSTDGYTAGGIGLQSDVAVVGQLSDLTISAPDGTVHHAVLMGQRTSRGTTTYNYEVCYVPRYYMASDTSTNPLPGGTWQVSVSGQISSATWQTNAEMTDVTFQQSSCPASEQNLA